MIQLDTSLLIEALVGPQSTKDALQRTIQHGEVVALSTIALYEWLRGPRTAAQVAVQEDMIPQDRLVLFGRQEAEVAALLYRTLRRPRARDIDLAIAACALTHGAALWTLNPEDFRDIPDLTLFAPPRS